MIDLGVAHSLLDNFKNISMKFNSVTFLILLKKHLEDFRTAERKTGM